MDVTDGGIDWSDRYRYIESVKFFFIIINQKNRK